METEPRDNSIGEGPISYQMTVYRRECNAQIRCEKAGDESHGLESGCRIKSISSCRRGGAYLDKKHGKSHCFPHSYWPLVFMGFICDFRAYIYHCHRIKANYFPLR